MSHLHWDHIMGFPYFAPAGLPGNRIVTMYSPADAISVKADWGNSSNIVGVELCQLAGARRLALFHHEPASDDAQIDRVLAETRRLEMLTREREALEIFSACDGLVIEL